MCRTFQLAGGFIANFRKISAPASSSEREGTGARGVGSVTRGRARLVDRLFTPLRAQRVLLDAWFSAIGRSPSVVRCFVHGRAERVPVEAALVG